MRRRFPPNIANVIGQNGELGYFLLGAAVLVAGAAFALRAAHKDNKLETTKRHHPKGVGFTGINHQLNHMRNITRKVSPNIDKNYYEYSRHNPSRER